MFENLDPTSTANYGRENSHLAAVSPLWVDGSFDEI